MSCCYSIYSIIFMSIFLEITQAQSEIHLISYQKGYYAVDNVLSVNQNSEYILSFPNTSTPNPYRISVYSEDATSDHPALVVVRQEKQVLSWQVPMLVGSSLGRLEFQNSSRTLCYSELDLFTQVMTTENDATVTSKRNFSVSISTSSAQSISVTVRADEVTEFFVNDDQTYTTTISPSEPVFYYYPFSATARKGGRVFIEIDSDDEVCLIVSVQKPFCPVRDLNQDIKYESTYQTVNLKGAMSITKHRYPMGFFLVFVAMGDNNDCNQESSILPMPKNRWRTTTAFNRTSEINFKIREGITSDQYITAIFVVLGINLGFCVIFIFVIALFFYCTKKQLDSDENDDEDVVDSPAKDEADVVYNYLEKEDLTVHDFCLKSEKMQKKSFNYFWHIMNIGIFYGIPVVQLMVAYQRMVNLTGDLDTCYHNFMCAHPFIDVYDFNHIYSNIGYMTLGILFLCVTLFRQKKHVHIPNCGIPRHYGLFYAMGVALILEGIFSACYHICPNQSNYQFDTSFMYVMAVLCMIKLYQNRHPRINASAYATFTILGVAVFMAMLGILTNSTGLMIIFVISYVILCVFLSFKIYFFGYVLFGVYHVFNDIKKRTDLKSLIKPIRRGRFILLTVANICNLAMAIVGIIFYPSYTDFGTYLLVILMANSVLHTVFYICMKLSNKERLCFEACLYILFAVALWAGSGYFFLNGSTLWTVTPAQSRQLNVDCIFLDFYDPHDVWHLMSAPALFFSFMMLMHLDDDLAEVPRKMIKSF